ncbi:MAG: PH domain-containing protein, partial [Sphingobacterium sp.]
ITISDKRIFLCEFTKLGLATNFEIFTWENIKDIAFKEEIFGSKVTVIPFTGENLTVDYIPKVQARKLYQLIKLNLDELNKPKPQMPRVENTIPQVLAPKIEKDQSVQVPATSSAGLTQKLDENPIRRHNETLPVGEPAEIKSNSTPTIAVPGLNATEDDELTRKLKKLKSLYDRQLITQMEYENKKLELLSQL